MQNVAAFHLPASQSFPLSTDCSKKAATGKVKEPKKHLHHCACSGSLQLPLQPKFSSQTTEGRQQGLTGGAPHSQQIPNSRLEGGGCAG